MFKIQAGIVPWLLLENPLSGIYYPLMPGILRVMGLEGISVYPLTDTDTLR